MKHLGKPEGVASALGVSNPIVIPTFVFGLQAWVHYAKAWGYCMKKIGQNEPHLPFSMKEGGVGGFLTLVLTKLVTLKSDKKSKVSEVRNCNVD